MRVIKDSSNNKAAGMDDIPVRAHQAFGTLSLGLVGAHLSEVLARRRNSQSLEMGTDQTIAEGRKGRQIDRIVSTYFSDFLYGEAT